jgi:hypothetical protein
MRLSDTSNPRLETTATDAVLASPQLNRDRQASDPESRPESNVNC